ncbi:hypothetical protein FS749_016119 [Ceratobasidium sp. UAMH 11750]|nr:hypothetical protein FS749_016119 [Ceratobasidium sp. UAMH 11750]
MAYPPPLSTLSEGGVLNAFNFFLDSAIADARGQGLIPYESGGNEPHVIITGSALCLYSAAIRSETTLPSVLLPHFGGIPKRLHYNTCPDPFVGLFQRWAEIVPQIQSLSKHQKADLENVICNGPLVPLRPAPYHPYMGHSAYNPIHRIAESLRILAQDISHCRNLRMRRESHYTPTIDTSFANQTWAPPPQESPYSTTRTHIHHPTPQTQFDSFPNWPQRASPPAVYEPASSTESTASFSSALFTHPLGSTNDQGKFIGGFAPPQHGATVPEQASGNRHMASPSPEHFNTPSYSPVEDQHRRNTIAGIDYDTSRPYNTTFSTDTTATVIGSRMPISDIIAQLCLHGCKDLTRSLDLSSFSSRPISRGGFGEIYRGRLRDGTQVAVKTIFTPEEYNESKPLKHSARELYTWSKCDHPNVAHLMGLAEFNSQIAMVSPWMENGHLRNYVKNNPTVDRLGLCAQIANGLAYLHSIKIVHGDLKGPNVLISATGSPILIDFGNATQSESTLQFAETATKGYMTMRWAAPEIFWDGKPSQEADVYALGMTILEAFTGKVPYFDKGDPAVIKTVVTDKKVPDRPQEIPTNFAWADMLWNLLIDCWRYAPSERPTARNVCSQLQKISEVTSAPAPRHT